MNDYIYSDEENVSKQPQSDENLFVERRSEQPNGGPLEFAGHKGDRGKELYQFLKQSLKMNILHVYRRHKIQHYLGSSCL